MKRKLPAKKLTFTCKGSPVPLASSQGLFFLLKKKRNETDKRNGWTNTRKNRPGIHCRGCSAHALEITQNLGNCMFALYYSVNYLASTSCNNVSVSFIYQPGYLFLDHNLGEVDSNRHQVQDRFSVVLVPSIRLCIRCVRAVIAVSSLLCNYKVHLCA